MNLYWVFFILCGFVWAQNASDSVIDLSELNIEKRKAFGKTSEVWRSDSMNIYSGIAANLGEQIASTSAIPFRNYGQGLLQSISTRGLTPQHTYVEWQGVPINSALNGQQDFSLLNNPLSIQAKLTTGSSATLLGSGAVGGALLLSNTPNPNQKLEASLRVGSFGFLQGNIRLAKRVKKWRFLLGSSVLDSENTYSFRTLSGTRSQQSNADLRVENYALQAQYNHTETQKTQLDVWHVFGERGLPANRVVPINNQLQEDNQTRVVLSHLYQKGKSKHEARLGFTNEETLFFLDRRVTEEGLYNRGQTLIAKYDWRFIPYKNWQFNTHIQLSNASASGDNLKNEALRDANLSFSARYRLKPNLSLVSSLRKGVSNRFSIPFTYDFGTLYKAGENHELSANYATSFRNPTLNDLFWRELGNPNLNSEEGYMFDLNYSFRNTKKIHFSVNGFFGKFDEWIVWLPGTDGTFRPQNIQRVKTLGLELALNKKWKWNTTTIGLNTTYQYTQTTDEDRNAQLIYTPFHSANLNAVIERKKYRIYWNNRIQGKSFATRDESVQINGFLNTNIGAQYGFGIGSTNVKLGIEVRNLWDNEIETIRNFTAPERNYMFELLILLK